MYVVSGIDIPDGGAITIQHRGQFHSAAVAGEHANQNGMNIRIFSLLLLYFG